MDIDDLFKQMAHEQAAPEQPQQGNGGGFLDQFGRNLTQIAKTGLIDPVIGREEEVEINFEFTALPGEIVEVDGYDGFFKVDCQHVDVERYANEKFTEVYYDVINIHTDEWVVACDEDLTLVADAAAADDFIANMGPKKPKARKFDAMDITIYQFEDKGAINMAGKNDGNERKLTPREQSNKEAADKKAARKKRKEYVDRALDGRLTAKDLIEVFPQDKAKYERRIARYDRFLAKVSDAK